jgi:single-strand DNA-binding protein
MTRQDVQGDSDDNTVVLRGVLAAKSEARELPSGDQMVSFRVTVARPPGERTRVDSIDCATTNTRVLRCLERAGPGDRIELAGSLHRRFWRSPNGVASRYEVTVSSARLSRRRRSDA